MVMEFEKKTWSKKRTNRPRTEPFGSLTLNSHVEEHGPKGN